MPAKMSAAATNIVRRPTLLASNSSFMDEVMLEGNEAVNMMEACKRKE